MTIGDRWGAEESPSGFELQYAGAVEGDSPQIANYIRTTGDVLGGLLQLQRQYQQAQVDDALIRTQIERARAGQSPVMPVGTPSTGGGIFGSMPGWQLAALGALMVGGLMLARRGR